MAHRCVITSFRLTGVELLIGTIVLAPASSCLVAQETKTPDLATQVQQILLQHCFECHGKYPKKLKGDLNLFDRSHLDDKERKIVVAKAPDESELVKKVESEEMPPDKRPKLPAEMRKTLRAWVVAGAPAFPAKTPVTEVPKNPIQTPVAAGGADLAAAAKGLFRNRCFECHGGTKINAGVKILDRDLLIQKEKVNPGKPDDSKLFQLISARDDSVMPPAGQPRLNADDIELVRRWIGAGAPAFPEDVVRPEEKDKDAAFKNVVGVDYVHKKILEHVRTLRSDDRRYYRYFSLNHLLTAGTTRAELDLQRDALAKALNHLSWEPTLARPQPIDSPTESVYAIDLRKLGWQKQVFTRMNAGQGAGQSERTLFDLLLLEYPYGVVYEDSDTYDHLTEEFLTPTYQVRPIPYIRADWFVSVITQPPLYEDLLQLPFELKELETQLGVDSAANLNDYVAKRAGMTVSGVSRNNRVVERHPAKYGSYWKSFDFKTSKGQENMFQDPVNLHPAGGEMIFTLPNGLQGYLLALGKGTRLDAAPTEIVTDKFAEDKTVRNGLACMRCHDGGMKTFRDDVRSAVQHLPGSAGLDKRQILQLYPESKEMDSLVQKDAARFMNAMAQLLGKPQVREPLIPVTQRFLDGPLQLTAAAAELGYPEPSALRAVFRSPRFAALGLLPLAAEGVVRRDMWEDYYDQVVRGLGLGVPVVPLDGLTRRDFRPEGALTVELATNKRSNVFEPGEGLVVTVRNKSAIDVCIELVGTSARGEKVVLAAAPTWIKAGQEYRYPAEGEIKIRGGLGKEQITLFAADGEFPPGEVLRGRAVTDRFVHPFYEGQRGAKGKAGRTFDPGRMLKQTIDIETR